MVGSVFQKDASDGTSGEGGLDLRRLAPFLRALSTSIGTTALPLAPRVPVTGQEAQRGNCRAVCQGTSPRPPSQLGTARARRPGPSRLTSGLLPNAHI